MHAYTFECSFLSHNFPIIKIRSFFLKRVRPESVGKADWPGTLWIQTLPYWGVSTSSTRASFSGDWPILCALPESSLPGTTKAKFASLLHTNHQRQEMPHKDPKAQLAAELALRCHTLQEQFPGALTWVQSQKQAQSGCWLWPHQPLDGKLAGANKAKAASQPASQTLMCLSCKTPFCIGTDIPLECSQKGSWFAKNETARNNLRKENFVVRGSTYAIGSMFSMGASKKRVQRNNSAMQMIHFWARDPS